MKKFSKQLWRGELAQKLFHVEYCPAVRLRNQTPHAHDFAEVFWVCQGAVRHRINARDQTMLTGDLCMIRPDRDRHQVLRQTADFIIFNVAFPCRVLHDIRDRYALGADFWGGRDVLPGLYHLTPTEQAWLHAAAMELRFAPQDRMQIDRFLLNLLGSTGKSITDPYRACPPWLRAACDAIHRPEHLRDGLATFFATAGRAPEHTARTLKQRTGKTPTEVLVEARLAHAAALLATTDREILDVCMDCGFASLSYFYKIFRRAFGITPRLYRRTYFKTPICRMPVPKTAGNA